MFILLHLCSVYNSLNIYNFVDYILYFCKNTFLYVLILKPFLMQHVIQSKVFNKVIVKSFVDIICQDEILLTKLIKKLIFLYNFSVAQY